MLLGRRGNPDVWVARSTNVMVRPPRSGIFTVFGRYFATGSDSETSPRSTIPANSIDVKTLVSEPISNTVSPSTGRGSSLPIVPYATIRRKFGPTIPTTIPVAWRRTSTRSFSMVRTSASDGSEGGGSVCVRAMVPDRAIATARAEIVRITMHALRRRVSPAPAGYCAPLLGSVSSATR